MEIEGYLTVNEAAEFLKVSGGRIRQFISEGRLDSIKVGNTRLIKQVDLENLEIKKSGRPEVEKPNKATLAKRKSRSK
jgi:excisionase family DNA binding protein